MAHHLVAGGGGFIGSHMVDALLERGDTVTIVDNFVTGRRANIAHLDGHGLDSSLLAQHWRRNVRGHGGFQ